MKPILLSILFALASAGASGADTVHAMLTLDLSPLTSDGPLELRGFYLLPAPFVNSPIKIDETLASKEAVLPMRLPPHEFTSSTSGYIAYSAPQSYEAPRFWQIQSGGGSIRIGFDGTVKLDGVTLDDAAVMFWGQVARLSKTRLAEQDAKIAELKKTVKAYQEAFNAVSSMLVFRDAIILESLTVMGPLKDDAARQAAIKNIQAEIDAVTKGATDGR